jgi:hypothetical protein
LVPIVPYLNGRSFDPEMLKCMGSAFEAACKQLGLKDKSDPITEILAERVIALVRPDETDPDALCERVLRSLSAQ